MSSGEAWVAVAIDDVEQIDWRRTGISWRPVRQALGVDIAGMAAFTAQCPGEVVVEPHTEVGDGRGHQEVYIVIRGCARFVVDGAVIQAPAGTLVRVDPQAHREATAVQAHTAVLVLGGESNFEPSASEWIERARPHIRTDPARAREIIEALRRQMPGDRAIDVGEALLAVGENDASTARLIVARLLADRPIFRTVLSQDPDLGELLPE